MKDDSLRQPAVYVASFGAVVDAQQQKLTVVGGVFLAVALVPDLLQGGFSAAVELEFHDVDETVCLYRHVGASAAGM